MSQSMARRYRRLIIETDEYLRKQYSNGSRVHISYHKVAEAMNVSSSSMSSVLNFLADIKDSGLVRIKGEGGKYEYSVPVGYPRELSMIKADLKSNPSKLKISNPYVKMDVIAFFKRHPNEVQTISDVCAEVEGNRTSIGNAMLKLSRTGWLTLRADVGAGCYIYHSATVVDPNVDPPEEPVSSSVPVSVQEQATEQEKERERQIIAGRDHSHSVPSPSTVAARIHPAEAARRAFEEFKDTQSAAVAAGVALATHYPPDEDLYEFVQETKRGKVILRNRATQKLGYWEEM